MIYDSLLDLIGGTPVIRLSKLSARLGVSVFTKLESFNPGGSHKARIALWMILDAERKGILVRGKGQTILEPSGEIRGLDWQWREHPGVPRDPGGSRQLQP